VLLIQVRRERFIKQLVVPRYYLIGHRLSQPHRFFRSFSCRGHSNQDWSEGARPSRLNGSDLHVTPKLPGLDAGFFRHVLNEARAVCGFNRDVDISDGFTPDATRFNQRVGGVSFALLHSHHCRQSAGGDDEEDDQPLASPYPAQKSIKPDFVFERFFLRHLVLVSSAFKITSATATINKSDRWLVAGLAARDYQFNSGVVNFSAFAGACLRSGVDDFEPALAEAEVGLAGDLFSDTIDRLISVLYLPLPGIKMTSEIRGQEPTISFALRPACADDEAFLYELYCSTRSEEIAAWGLESSQRAMLLKLQFTAQRQHYELAYEGVEHAIILIENRPAGRIMVFRSEEELVLIDIALLPGSRGIGIGTALIVELLNEAKQAEKPVSLHVAKNNRARRLYERLGFEIREDTGVYFKMESRPSRI
jgi:ribosomal protein S18 acetylase RimI-like enzyme